ncbi:MAG: SCO family protein [Aquificaceae bacterium]
MCSLVRFFLGVIPLFLFFTYAYSQGTGIPPDESRTLGNYLPNVKLIDSNGRIFYLYKLKGKPLILSPVYTHCQSACPIITHSLKEVVYKLGEPGKDFWVLSFSFDPKDTLQDLQKFQREYGIDGKGWIVAMAVDKKDLFRFMDAIDFRFMNMPESRDFVHPNLLVFASQGMKIKKYLYGVVFAKKDMERALQYAMGKESLSERLRPYILFISLIGLALSGLYVFQKAFYRKKVYNY